MAAPTVRDIIRHAKIKAAELSTTPRAVLEGYFSAHAAPILEDGRSVVSTAEAGGETTFALPKGWDTGEVMHAIGKALDYLDSLANPNTTNPPLPKAITRLRVGFSRAMI